jgi:signal transduction histidine kinase
MAILRRPIRSRPIRPIRPIRLFLIGMFAVPLVSLVGLWAFAASVTAPEAISDHNYNLSGLAVTGPDVATLTIQLPAEQHQTYLWLLSGRKAAKSTLLATRQSIDQVLPGAEAKLKSGDNQPSPVSQEKLTALETDLRNISSIRRSVDAGMMTPAAAFQAYGNIMDAQFQFYYAETLDQGTSLQAIGIGAIDAALEMETVSREATLMDGALNLERGRMDATARQLFDSSATRRQLLMDQALSLLTPGLRAGYVTITRSPAYQQFQAMENQIAASTGSGPVPVNAKEWASDSGVVLGAMLTAEAGISTQLSGISSSASNWLFTKAILAGGIGLFAVLVSVFLLIWFGRKVTGDLTGLYTSVRGMAEERLPRVVERLRRGDDVDVLAESPAPATSNIQEISQIARSFGIVQEAAVAAAVEQARLRKGVNQVFLNISMRNQSLLHRQLGMLDAMERRTSEPGPLADLFRLDHLTTRMRRHAEGLIILSGSTPGRNWRDPVPVVDVLRAAVAEVEDYVRVDVLSESRDMVAGNAVNDVIHLVAELVENATVFSPPNTRIEVRADRAGTGLVAEVEDRGLGLSQEELDDINRRLASPPEFDLANSEQLGLFVVSRLAARHAIKVSLRQSVYGGTSAILLLPFGVIVREEEAVPGASQADWPGDGREPTDAALPPAAGGSAHSVPLPAFDAAGRHRLPAAATGRRADTDVSARDEEDRSAVRHPLPRPPWEYAQSEPQRPQASPSPEPRETPQADRPPWEQESDTSWFQPVSRTAAGWNTDRSGEDPPFSAPTAQFEQRAAADAASSASHLGMPVRVPQASLAPQLRTQGDDGQQANQQPKAMATNVDARSPEATRNMMILMQQGWERGRVDDLDEPAGISDNGTEQ